MQRPLIEFDLLTNAKDSFRQAVELLAHAEIGTDHARLKHAIMSSAHCIELMLKERLRRVHPAFIWERVDQYPSLAARTVSAELALARLKTLGDVSISADDERAVHSLRLTRNAIEHYEWRTSKREANVILGSALSFAVTFAKAELQIDLSAPFKTDDTWMALLNELFEFARVHGERLENQLRQQGFPVVECTECGASTVSLSDGTCSLCGHWQT